MNIVFLINHICFIYCLISLFNWIFYFILTDTCSLELRCMWNQVRIFIDFGIWTFGEKMNKNQSTLQHVLQFFYIVGNIYYFIEFSNILLRVAERSAFLFYCKKPHCQKVTFFIYRATLTSFFIRNNRNLILYTVLPELDSILHRAVELLISYRLESAQN